MRQFFLIIILALLAIPRTAISRPKTEPVTTAPLCGKCHQPEANLLRGFLKDVSFTDNTMTLDLEGRLVKIKFNNGTNIHRLNSLADMKNYTGEGFRVFYVNQGNKKLALHIARLDPLHLIGADNLLTSAEVEAMMAYPSPPVLVDIRSPASYLKGHIKGAVNIPGAATAEFNRRRPINDDNCLIIYGKGGDANESEAVINAMSIGYRNVRFYRGGIADWSRNHFTVCSLSYVRKAPEQNNFFLRLVDENNVLVDGKGLPVNLSAPPDSIRQIQARIPRDKTIILYGADHENTARSLIKMGYRQIKTIANGNSPWQERLAAAWPGDCY